MALFKKKKENKKVERSFVPSKATRRKTIGHSIGSGRRSYDAVKSFKSSGKRYIGRKSQNKVVKETLSDLREIARDQDRNNAYVGRYLSLNIINVVGASGIQLRADFTNSKGEQLEDVNREILTHWRKVTEPGVFDVTGRYGIIDVLSLVVMYLLREGESIIRLVTGKEHNIYGFAVELIEPDRLDENLNETLKNGNKIVMGIELNSWGRPVNYYFKSTPENGNFKHHGKHYVKLPASEIIHKFLPFQVSDIRGVSKIARAMKRLSNIESWEAASLTAARAAAGKMWFYVNNEIEEDENSGRYGGADFQKDEEGEFVEDAIPGAGSVVPRGYDVKTVDFNAPHSEFDPFQKAQLRGASAALDVSYASLSNDLSETSYSSMRVGLTSERDQYKYLQQYLIRHFVVPIFKKWLELTAVYTDVFKFINSKVYMEFLDPQFHPRKFDWIDPWREARAIIETGKHGYKSEE